MTKLRDQRPTILKAPANVKAASGGKVAKALAVRESASKARAGKPLAFPTRRMHP